MVRQCSNHHERKELVTEDVGVLLQRSQVDLNSFAWSLVGLSRVVLLWLLLLLL